MSSIQAALAARRHSARLRLTASQRSTFPTTCLRRSFHQLRSFVFSLTLSQDRLCDVHVASMHVRQVVGSKSTQMRGRPVRIVVRLSPLYALRCRSVHQHVTSVRRGHRRVGWPVLVLKICVLASTLTALSINL
ncbi:unnamed protein product [Scytosiphon promiscuus]